MRYSLKDIYNQLLNKSDLEIDDSVISELKYEKLTILVDNTPTPIIRLFSEQKLAISDILPIFHSFGFRVLNEISFSLEIDSKTIFINKLLIDVEDLQKLKTHEKNIKYILKNSITKNIKKATKLFKLTYLENFSFRQILLFKAIVHYQDQIEASFNINTIVDVLTRYPKISKAFLDYFIDKFSDKLNNNQLVVDDLLKDVLKMSDDRVLKLFFEILKNITKTNYFLDKETISIKIDTKNMHTYLRGVQPNIEMFVYHQEFSGIHLRMHKISRGGIRYSNRFEDYRDEIKSLMITQEGKNAIIIPQGAKGGFVIFENSQKLTKERFTLYYKKFISALLDLIDSEDSYFVVAADRGTSNMSDIANEISIKRGYWLKDAFASGGSNGFHHKKLGITAKGALKSVQRYFIEKGIDFYKEPITVVGLGSMNGDVFGNGMIQSQYFKLIGAISHDEIFIDPNPNIEIAFNERKRLFYATNSKWSQYDRSKISKGGGIFKRSAKKIVLTPQIKQMLNIKKEFLSGEELASRLLKLKIDMLYCGGIGTYIKSSEESNISIGDKENEYVRVDANEIRALSICEGANLAITQKARIEYAKNGGFINLDSIDNSAGVNISDHEVNLKILLNSLVEKEIMSEDEKNKTLLALSDYVVKDVLWTNYLQSLCISLDQERCRKKQKLFIKVIEILEQNLPVFKRGYFEIPKNVDLHDILGKDDRVVRPILSILLLYSKILLKDILNKSDLYQDDPFFERYLFKYFPKSFVSIYEDDIKKHPLRKEIISMIIANKIINFAGVTFVADINELGIDRFLLKIKSYLIVNQLFDANDIRYEIYRNDYIIDIKKQYKMLLSLENELEYNVNWMLKSLNKNEISFEHILEYKENIKKVSYSITLNDKNFIKNNEKLNSFFKTFKYLRFAIAIIKTKRSSEFCCEDVAGVFYMFVQKLKIISIITLIENLSTQNENEEILALQLQQLIESLLVDLTKEFLRFKREEESIESAFKNFLSIKHFHEIELSDSPTLLELCIVINNLLLLKE